MQHKQVQIHTRHCNSKAAHGAACSNDGCIKLALCAIRLKGIHCIRLELCHVDEQGNAYVNGPFRTLRKAFS